MSNEITQNLMCIVMRGGVEIWIEKRRIDELMGMMEASQGHKFFRLQDEMVNTADIVGIFKASTMQDTVRRRNGQWRCEDGSWHKVGRSCNCEDRKHRNEQATIEEAIRKCPMKCDKGWVMNERREMMKCLAHDLRRAEGDVS